MNLRRWTAALVLSGLTGLSFWLLGWAQSPVPTPSAGPQPPRYFMTGATLLHWNRKGRLVYRLQALLIEHLPVPGLYALTQPLLTEHPGPHTVWRVRARHGLLNSPRNQLRLWHHVRARQLPSPHHPSLLLSTSRLTVFFKTRRAESSQPVTLIEGMGHLSGTGFTLDLGRRVLTLRSRVRGLLPPAPRRPARTHPAPLA
jgi:LPS export ABC transporter protein LptC